MRYGTLLPNNNVNLNSSSISIHLLSCLNNDITIPLMDEFTELLGKSMTCPFKSPPSCDGLLDSRAVTVVHIREVVDICYSVGQHNSTNFLAKNLMMYFS